MAELEAERLGLLETLGVRAPNHSQWRLVRAAQLRELSRHTLLPLTAAMVACPFIIITYWQQIPALLMGSWLALLVLTIALAAATRRANRKRMTGASPADLARVVTNAALFGFISAIPPLFFVPYGGFAEMLVIAAICALTMAAAAVLLAAVPAAGIALVSLPGIALAVMFARLGLPLFAGLALCYAICLCYALLINGRALLIRLCNDISLAEQRAVVSLLLRQNSTGGDWIWQIDARKCIVDPSQRFVDATGLPAGKLEGMPLLQLLAGPNWEAGKVGEDIHTLLKKLQRGETFSELLTQVTIDDRTRWWKISGTPRLNADRRVIGYRGVIADVTDRQASERRTHHMAHFDALTGLANRAYTNQLLQDRIAESAENGSMSAFLLIDLDRFKAINDTLGHPVGDRLLEQVAARLNALAEKDDRCGRLGGDEFAMIVAHAGSTNMLDERARAIIVSLSEPYRVGDHVLHIGASVGSVIFPKDGRSGPTLLRNADLALYKAKESGRGVHCPYEPRLLRKADERRAIEVALRKAIASGEFHLAYQPVINLADRRIAGFEALLRWRSEELGAVSPDKFIPVAEETRLIDPIGEWVFRHACAEAATWPENYRLAINLSAGQLRNPRLSAVVASALSQSRLDPRRLEIETTEAILSRENEQALKTFEQVRSLGVTVALDDFGTGHSTLSLIGRTRFSSIKIDESFIQEAEQGSKASIAVIRAVIAMAESLGIATIVEGVENDRQFRLAESLGCSQVQGYFLNRPMSAEAVRVLIGEIGDRAVA